jgi:hypothetical protein
MTLNTSMTTTAILLCILATGCEQPVEQGPDKHVVNSRLIDSYNNAEIENAIISQHTLYPYHFVQNGAELNELGDRDLAVLAGHFMKHPGRLNIRRQSTPAALYEARVNFVRKRLQQAGIDVARITIADGMPGGPGMPSEQVLTILQNKSQGTSPGASSTSFGAASASMSGGMR